MRKVVVQGFGSKYGMKKEYPYTKTLFEELRAKCPNETLVYEVA